MIVATAAAVALAGCSIDETGTANRATNTDTDRPGSPSSAGASSTARPLPPRPRELDLTGVDPCMDVLTRDQLRQLAYDLGYQRAPQPNSSTLDNVRGCTYSSSRPPDQPSRDIGVAIYISLSVGAEVWLTDPNRTSSANLARHTTVEDFPALVLPNPRFVDHCAVVVDVHDGQYLEVSSTPSGGAKGTSPEPYCAEAQRVVGIVVQNLSARK